MYEKGKMMTCDRCGQQIFLRLLRVDATDSGYTQYCIFEDLPKTWLYVTQMGELCDKCAGIFRNWVTDFMNGQVANSWHKDKNDNDNEVKYEKH